MGAAVARGIMSFFACCVVVESRTYTYRGCRLSELFLKRCKAPRGFGVLVAVVVVVVVMSRMAYILSRVVGREEMSTIYLKEKYETWTLGERRREGASRKGPVCGYK